MFDETSRYWKIYNNLCIRGQSRKFSEGLYEKHHIIPKSLGGDNSKGNLTFLTYKEHFIVHRILPKILCDSNHISKMIWALHRMAFSRAPRNSQRTLLNSHQYNKARELHRKNMIENHPSKNNNNAKNWREKVSAAVKSHWDDNENRRQVASERMKKTWDEKREVMSSHCKSISKKGAEAAKAKLLGSTHNRGKKGKENPSAKRFEIISPSGEIMVTNCLKEFCSEKGLNYGSMINVSRGLLKSNKGYSIISKQHQTREVQLP